jgi:hypothetical protein
MTVGASSQTEGSFICTDTRMMFADRSFVDPGGKLISTGSGWATGAGKSYDPWWASMTALRESGRVWPGCDVITRAGEIVSGALGQLGKHDERFHILLIEPGAGVIAVQQGKAQVMEFGAGWPAGLELEEESRQEALAQSLRDVGEELFGRIKVVAHHFDLASQAVSSMSDTMEIGYILPTPDGPVNGFLRGKAREIAATPPNEIAARFQAMPSGKSPRELWQESDRAERLEAETLQLDNTTGFVIPTKINAGNLPTGIRGSSDFATNNSGVTTSFGVNRHNDEQAGLNTVSKTFGVSFDAIPQIRALPQSWVLPGASSTVDRVIEFKARNVTVSGYDVRAVSSTGSSASAKSENWATTLNGTPAASQTLANINASAYADLSQANAVSTAYTANFDVDTTAMLGTNTLHVSLYKNNGTGSTSWTLVASHSFGSGVNTSWWLAFNAAMALDWDCQIQITYQNVPAVGQKASVVVHTLTYPQITAGTETDITTAAGNAIIFQAMEAP